MGELEDAIKEVAKYNKGEPVASHKMTFDSQQAQLEPIYYWLLDFISDSGWDPKKITDNFTSSPGSGHFAEMGQRATRMQEEGMKILGGMNQVIKSSIQLIYDLKEFEMRLAHYDDFVSDDKQKKESGMLALKQVWLDNVDLKRGRGSIHQMATAEMGFTTLREAFLMANSVDDLKKMNDKDGVINDQVMRVLIPRISEFTKWIKYSEDELRKRMSIEKNYLKSQVETIKLYSQWMKPYLVAAEQLEQKGFDENAALVNAFSTSMFELKIMGKKKAKPYDKLGNYKLKRDYFAVVVIGMKYRGHVSQRVTQKGDYGYAMGGRVDMTFDAYALNSEELELIDKKLKDEDVLSGAKFSMGMADDALKELQDDLNHFLKSDKERLAEKEKEDKEKKKESGGDDINPFLALFGLFKKGEKKEKKGEKKEIEDVKDIKKDNYVENTARMNAAGSASSGLYAVYDIYKKVHGMASSPEAFENSGTSEEGWEKKAKGKEVGFTDLFKGGFEKAS